MSQLKEKIEGLSEEEIFSIIKGSLKGVIRRYRNTKSKRDYLRMLAVNQQIDELVGRGLLSEGSYDRLQLCYITNNYGKTKLRLSGGHTVFAGQSNPHYDYPLIAALAKGESRL